MAAAKREEECGDQVMAGATGRFPQGMLNADDEGELIIAVGLDQGKIIVHFGKEVAWFGLDADSAEAFANNILQKVATIRGVNS